MKCPYCNYVSFDYLNSCKKCSKDLSAHKSKFDINYLEPISLGILSFAAAAPKASAAPAGRAAAESFSHEEFHSPTSDTDDSAPSSVEEAMGGAMGGGDDSFGFTLEDSTGDFNLPDAEGDIEIPERAQEAPVTSKSHDEISFDSDELSLGHEEEAPATAAMEPAEEIAMEEPAVEEIQEIAMEEPAVEEIQEIAMEEPVMEEVQEIAMEEPVMEEAAPEISMEEPVMEEAPVGGDEEVVSSDSGFSLGLGEDMGGLDSELDFSGIGSSGGGSGGGAGGGEFEDVNLNDDDIFGGGSGGKDDELELDLDKA